jgi:hypothetical protein
VWWNLQGFRVSSEGSLENERAALSDRPLFSRGETLYQRLTTV